MTDDTSADVPAAFSGPANGTVPPARQTADGVAAIAGMLSQFPQALAQVLQQVPVTTRQHLCASCVMTRLGWQAAHEPDLKAALARAAQAHGISENDPRVNLLDPAPFLPAELQPGAPQGIPPLTAAITMVGGTEVCSEHIPGRPGGKQLLLASGPLSSSMLAGLG